METKTNIDLNDFANTSLQPCTAEAKCHCPTSAPAGEVAHWRLSPGAGVLAAGK